MQRIGYSRRLLTSLLLTGLFAVMGTFASAQAIPWAWGFNGDGELGEGTNNEQHSPVDVKSIFNVVQLAGGTNHSLALTSNGRVWAWGLNNYGQLGDGTNTNKYTPLQISSLSGIIQVSAGGRHSLALRSDGTVWAWGLNNYGQLGNGTTDNNAVPVQVKNLKGVVQVAAGDSYSLALKSNGTVWAWGYNYDGELGIGAYNSGSNPTPVQTKGLTSIIQIVAGGYHALALKSDKTVWAWGYNYWGQVGDGSSISERDSPVQVPLGNVIQIAGGGYHSIALRSNGTVWTWGHNGYGQLGNGGTNGSQNTPGNASGLTGIVQVGAGVHHSVALKADGTVWTWGRNDNGQLGNGTTTNSNTPLQLTAPTGITYISAGGFHTLAVSAILRNTKLTGPSLVLPYATKSSVSAKLTLQTEKSPLPNQPIAFSIDGTVQKTRRTLASGFASFDVPLLNLGDHALQYDFAGDSLFSPSSSSGVLTIVQADTVIKMPNLKVNYGTYAKFIATLTRQSDGTNLSGQTLTFTLDGNLLGTGTTDKTGVVQISYFVDEALTIGAHTITVAFAGDANHNDTTLYGTFTTLVTKTVTTSGDVTGNAGTTAILTAKLKRGTDLKALVGRTITFQIDGKDVGTATTDAKGAAVFSYAIPSDATKGKHPLTAKYDGESIYLKSSDAKNLTVN